MNIDQNSENHFDFVFMDGDSEEDIIALKTTDFQNQKPGTFHVELFENWNHTILGTFIEVLYYFKERGIQWEKFQLDIYPSNQLYTSPLIQMVNGLNLFKEIELLLYFAEGSEYFADCNYLFPGIMNNKRLEKLIVDIETDDVPDDLVRGEELLHPFTPFLQETTTLKELELKRFPNINTQSFLESLAENGSLKRVFFEFLHVGNIADDEISQVIGTLAAHPKLEDLRINTANQFGELSSQAIQKLLSDSTTLSNLELFNYSDHGRLNAECIIEGLKKSQSLKELTTRCALYGDLILSRLFCTLSNCPGLERLYLLDGGLNTNDLEHLIHLPRLPRPIILNYPVDKKFSLMRKLLHSHPEVRLKPWNYTIDEMSRYELGDDIDLKHIYELNWYGRYLLDRKGVPLSLWPLVFEKIKNKPSVIYEFLKGPSFVSREGCTL